jgi:hypothetical protein
VFHLVDLADLPFDRLRQRVLAHAILAIMKAVDLKDPGAVLAELFDILELALDPERNPALLSRYLQYFVSFTENLDMPTFAQKLKKLPHSPMKTKGLTLAQQFIAAGRKEGIAAGREEGQRTALLATVRRLLTRRFGPLPEAVELHLRNASSADLDQLADDLLDAPSLNALFPEILSD